MPPRRAPGSSAARWRSIIGRARIRSASVSSSRGKTRTRPSVFSLVLRRAMLLAVAAVAAGAAAAYALARVLASVIYGVSPTDAGVFTGVAALLAMVAFAATWIPARRATRVDPVEALRW